MGNFVRKWKRGTGKYKGMLPLICFNCAGVVHIANKCPYKKNKRNEEEYDRKKKKKIQKCRRNKKKIFKKIICTKEDSSSSDEDEANESGTERVFLSHNL